MYACHVGTCYPTLSAPKTGYTATKNCTHFRAQNSAKNRVFSGTSRKNRENPRGAFFSAKCRKIRDFRPILGPENACKFWSRCDRFSVGITLSYITCGRGRRRRGRRHRGYRRRGRRRRRRRRRGHHPGAAGGVPWMMAAAATSGRVGVESSRKNVLMKTRTMGGRHHAFPKYINENKNPVPGIC